MPRVVHFVGHFQGDETCPGAATHQVFVAGVGHSCVGQGCGQVAAQFTGVCGHAIELHQVVGLGNAVTQGMGSQRVM